MASKKKVIAVTEIHRTLAPGERGDKAKGIRPKPPKVQIIAPKTVFMASTEADREDGTSEFDRLLASGAAREPEKDEKVAVDIQNIVPDDDENAKKTGTKKTVNKTETKGTESGTTKTSANAGTTKSGSQTGKGGEGDGSDLV